MKILAIADIHGDVENLFTILDKIREQTEFDVIVCPGDWTEINPPKGFTQLDIAMLILEELKRFGKPIIATPGNVDTKDIIPYLEEEGVSVHGRGIVIENVGFYGYGGAKTPFNTNIEPTDEELRLGLEKSYKEVKNAKLRVQVTHMPPYMTKIDLISSGMHVGSKIIRDFIEKNQPHVAISAHVHEAYGIDRIDNTYLINPGRLPEGRAGIITIDEENKKVGVDILKILV